MSAADETRAEAARRYPMHNQASIWHEMHLAGFHAFLAGVDWQASRDAGEVARAGKDLARMNREWTKVAAINESLVAQLQAAQATIAEALSYFEDGSPEGAAKLLRRAANPSTTPKETR